MKAQVKQALTKQPLTKQQLGLGFALLVTLWFTFWGTSVTTSQSNPSDIALPSRTLESTRLNVPAQSDLTVLKRQFIPAQHSLFTLPPAPVAPIIAVKEKPMVQKTVVLPPPVLPLPFKYLGRWQTADQQSVSLDYRGEVLNVQAGETIAGQYQVTKIEEVAGGLQIQFLSLSNNQIQTMRIGVSQ